MSDNNLATWIEALATSAAVVVALFKDELQSLWRAPRLVPSLKLGAPDCHKTVLSGTDIEGHHFAIPCYYLRIWVENFGKSRAQSVQVFVSALRKKYADGKFQSVSNFHPMNLKWSHSQVLSGPEIFAEGISSGMGKHCDLGFIVKPAERYRLGLIENIVDEAVRQKTILSLDLEVKPNTRSHLITPGVYQIDLKIAASNSKPVKVTYELNITGDWFDDETKMFSEGIGISSIE